jgi:hypothetical protein
MRVLILFPFVIQDKQTRPIRARSQGKYVQSPYDLGAIDFIAIPIRGPKTADDQILSIDGTAVEVRNLNRIGGVSEVDNGDSALVPGLHKYIAARNGRQPEKNWYRQSGLPPPR